MARSSSSPVAARYYELAAAFNAKYPRAKMGMLEVVMDIKWTEISSIDEDGDRCTDNEMESVRFICNIHAPGHAAAGTGFEGIAHIQWAMKDAGILDSKRGNGTNQSAAVSVQVPGFEVDEIAYQLFIRGVRVRGMTGNTANKRADDELMAQAKREVGA